MDSWNTFDMGCISVMGINNMLRFCEKKLTNQNNGFEIIVTGQIQMLDEKMWKKGRECFRRGGNQDVALLQMVSVLNAQERFLCYGWQDYEANRELRMLNFSDLSYCLYTQ